MHTFAVLAACGLGLVFAQDAAGAEYVAIPAGRIASVLANDADRTPAPVAAFSMRVMPVTNAEFHAFVSKNTQWRRGRAPAAFVDGSYLGHWASPLAPGGAALPDQPVTAVSWFAAQAFCESETARLPTWLEWEYVAAADATRTDARSDEAWRAGILAWYATPATAALQGVGGAANAYGVRDIHGLVWEWVDDFNALLVSPDSRNQGDPDKLQFCGAGAISLQDRENYAVLMRIALLSSLSATHSTSRLGFRCARPGVEDAK